MTDIAIHVDQTRAEGTIGASDAAGILGLDRYRPPIFHWRRLRGLEVDDALPASVQEAALWGQVLEGVIRGRYALDRQCGVFVPSASFVKDGWLRATPDGEVITALHLNSYQREPGLPFQPGTYEQKPPGSVDGLVQIKTASAWLADEWESGPPARYEVQCRVEMAVCDLSWDDIVCLIGGQRMVTYRVHRDMEIEERILTDLRAFWDSVQAGREPEVDGSDSWREYAGSKMRKTAIGIQADEDIEDDLTRWKEVRRVKKQLDIDEATIKTRMLLKLSAAGATKIKSSRGVVSAYQTGGRTDWKGYALELGAHSTPPPKFVKPSTTWALRNPFGNDDEE